jgi:PleD family two-component response regulator
MTFALVIDDNKQTIDALIQMSKLWKITAQPALSPSVAMAVLSKDTPAIVFLDINMPDVDGFEVLAYLRREPRLVKVPVIIATSDDQPQTSKRAMDEGATEVIIKPVMADILEKVFKKIGIFPRL